MINMSYCRFHNTKLALEECMNTIDDQEIESKDELKTAKHMFINFLEYCKYQGIIEDYNEEEIEEIINGAIMDNYEEDED